MVASDRPLFDVFLCHNTADKPAVRQIAAKLRALGLKTWLDEDEILAGQSWLTVLEEQIGEVKAAAVFIGKDGIGRWQQEESHALFRRSVEQEFSALLNSRMICSHPFVWQRPILKRTAPRSHCVRLRSYCVESQCH